MPMIHLETMFVHQKVVTSSIVKSLGHKKQQKNVYLYYGLCKENSYWSIHHYQIFLNSDYNHKEPYYIANWTLCHHNEAKRTTVLREFR